MHKDIITQEVTSCLYRGTSRVPCQGLTMMASCWLATPPPPSTWRHASESGYTL